MAASSSNVHFTFTHDPTRSFATFVDRKCALFLEKWGLSPSDTTVGQHYSYEAVDALPVRRSSIHEFLVSLLNSPTFHSHMRVSNGKGGLTRIQPPAAGITKVKFTPLRSTCTDMSLFDRLQKNREILRHRQGTCKEDSESADDDYALCGMPDVFLEGGATVSDQLRGVFMLGEESEFCDTFDAEEKNEFLYHIMWRLLSGGSAINQYEDTFMPYKVLTAALYKDMVSVSKIAASTDDGDCEAAANGSDASELIVQSIVFQIHAATTSGGEELNFFPVDDGWRGNHNFLYVCVHPRINMCSVWYNGFSTVF